MSGLLTALLAVVALLAFAVPTGLLAGRMTANGSSLFGVLAVSLLGSILGAAVIATIIVSRT